MTCSIVAVDPKAGESGFAIASCCFDAGQVCLAVPGKGAIASQAQGNLEFLEVFAAEQAAGRSLQQTMDSREAEGLRCISGLSGDQPGYGT